MNLDDLKDQLKERADQLGRQLQDSPVYIVLKEKYDLLSVSAQKLVLAGLAAAAAFILLFPPLSMILTASEQMEEFEDNRRLARDLLNVQRELKQGPNIPTSYPLSEMESRARSILQSAGLLTEQIAQVEVVSPRIAPIVSKAITSEAVLISLAKLNLRQIVDIGYSLQTIGPSVKLSQMKVQASADDDHYFDVLFELTSFSVPTEETETAEPQKRPRGK